MFEFPFKTTKQSKLQWLQFQILHRIIPTNDFLHKIKVKESPACSFCKSANETIEHLFADCYCVKEIWESCEEWLLRKFEMQVTFDKNLILFGKYKERILYKVHNLLILITKQYIFASRYKEVPKLNFNALENIITNRISLEKYILLKNCRFSEFERHWQKICDLL